MDSESRPNQVNTESKGKDDLLKGDWGISVIDQARLWDLPPSPQSSGLVWSATGTEIWKNNNNNNNCINNNNSQTDKTKGSTNQWGHTPSTHIGGTWGEEEDSANLWTGVPSSNNVRAFYEPKSSSDNNGTSLWGNTSANKPDNGGLIANTGAMSAGGAFNSVTVSSSSNNAMSIMSPADNVALKDKGIDASASNLTNWGPMSAMGFNKNENSNSSGWDGDNSSKKRSSNVPLPVAQPGASSNSNAPPSNSNFDDGTSVWGNPDRNTKVSKWKEGPNAKIPVNSANRNENDPPSMMISSPEVSSPSPGMIRLPPGASGLPALSSNNSLVGNGVMANKLPPMNSLMGESSSDGQPNIGEWDDGTISSLGTEVWGSTNKPVNRGWAESLINSDTHMDSQSSNMPPKTNTIPNNAAGVRDVRDSTSSMNSQRPVSWGVKANDNAGAMKSVPGTPSTPGSISAGGWGTDLPANSLSYWNPKPRGNWLASDETDSNNWNGPKMKLPGEKGPLESDKVYQLLLDMGCKKEDIEHALRSSGYNVNDLNERASLPKGDNDMDMRGKGSSNTLPSPGGNPGLPASSLPSINIRGSFSNPSPMIQPTSPPTHHPNVQQPSQQPRDQHQLTLGIPHTNLLTSQAPLQTPNSALLSLKQVLKNHSGRNAVPGQPNLPSEKQLLHLVQQIQLAVQGGHLNAQILNQPLAMGTIQLINSLLQNIKQLAQLQAASCTQHKNGGPMNNSSQSSLNVQITQTKLRIANLQNQIQHQQTQFLKQQPGHQGAMPGPSQSGDQSMQPNNQSQIPSQSGGQSHLPTPSAQTTQHKPIPPITQSNHAQEVIQHGLDSEFRDLTIKDFGPQQAGRANASSGSGMPASPSRVRNGIQAQQTSHPNPQSRLETTWKLSPFERDDPMGADFLRAPGSIKQSNPNNQMRAQDVSGDSWRSMLPGNGEDVNVDVAWPSDTVMSAGASSPVVSSSNSVSNASKMKDISNYNISDLVAEFEPGKPWKGTSGTKIEDDPHITPGSIARSPLLIRDGHVGLFTNNWAKGTSPTSVASDNLAPSLGLSSSTWAFNPNTSAAWGSIANDIPTPSGPESPWNGSISKTRGPPPGLGQDRNAPRGDPTMPGIRPQASSLDWMLTPSNNGDQLSAVANANLDSKDVMFSRMMAGGGGIDLGMGIGVGGIGGGAPRGLDDSVALGLKTNLALNRCNSTNPILRPDLGIQQGINQDDGSWQLWSYMQ